MEFSTVQSYLLRGERAVGIQELVYSGEAIQSELPF